MQSIKPINTLARRQFGRLALGSAAALALAACGGGGGGDSSSGELDLRAAYDRIEQGMDYDDVNKAVGAQSKDDNRSTRYWDSGIEHLIVGFSNQSDGSWLVGSVQWYTTSGRALLKEFNLT